MYYYDQWRPSQQSKPKQPSIAEKYKSMMALHAIGKITTEEWQAYCTELLYTIMEANKEIFERLKTV